MFDALRPFILEKLSELIIDDVEYGLKYAEIKEKYGFKNISNISRIVKEKSKWIAEFEKDSSPLRKTTKTTKYTNIDKGIRNFVFNCNSSGTPIGTEMIRDKALELVKMSGQTELKISNGYIWRALHRTQITLKKQHGEANSVDPDLLIQLHYKLSDYIKNADPKDIWNGDELGLFWRILPRNSYVVKDGVCKFGKQSKERITAENPRNIVLIKKLPLYYRSNSKAWMTGEIFWEFVDRFNKFNIEQKRFSFLFVDNCAAHPTDFNFSNVKVAFLPPNTTSVLQPMDAGVIKCFKGHYRVKFTRKVISYLEKDNFSKVFRPTLVNLFEALEMVCSAWNDVKQETVSNCFRHCGFK
ncbi:unnamed protein product [Brachionus calyciflorus]|uniref:HTH CENPB-type domain-containing protein n=1 Tax=Brachionus calyciflorus TaxID=104777 RepID=A0A813UU53_9BILA|nr:unnamed protein product [Brachionus calyciflorus]